MWPGWDEAFAIAGVVQRPRLFRVLDSALVRVCVLQGPSGAGKTTLVRSWAGQRDDPTIIWISLSSRFGSRKAFWEHVASSAARLGTLSEQTLAEVMLKLNRSSDPVRIASELLREAGPIVLVFDAYERLAELIPVADEDLGALVREVPELRLIVTSRAPTRLTNLILDEESIVRVISFGELALTVEEVSELIRAQARIDDPKIAASVTQATRGFALAVRAATQTLAQLGRVPAVDSPEWSEVVATRLESLLPSQEAVRFVTDTAVPPYFDLDLGRSLSGREDVDSLLDTLERDGFGRWIPYAPGRRVFQYVETIRETFRARAAADEQRFSRSCVETASWLLQNEEVVDQALQFAIEGADFALADRIFVALVIGNPDSYISDRFLGTLSSIPEAELQEYPMLAFGLALALAGNPILRGQAPRVAELAAGSTAQPRYIEPAVDAFSLAAMRAIAWRLALQFRKSAVESVKALQLLEEIPASVIGRYAEHCGTILRQLSYSLFQGGESSAAIAAITRSVALCETQTTRDYSAVYAAGYRAFQGDVIEAGSLLATINIADWPFEFRSSFMNGLGLVAEGYRHLDELDFAAAIDTVNHAASFIRTAEFWPFLTAISVSGRHGVGQPLAEARRVLRELDEQVVPPGVGENVATQRLYGVLAHALIAGGDQRAATGLLKRFPEDLEHLASARIALLLGSNRDEQALRFAHDLNDLPLHTIRSRAEVQLLGAAAALRRGRREIAWEWLGSSAIAQETYGIRTHLMLLSPKDRHRLREFAESRGSQGLLRLLEWEAAPRYAEEPAIQLTRREKVVLDALAEHGSARVIAEKLVVSTHTVKSQLQSLYRKLGVSSRAAALSVARERGLLEASGEVFLRAEQRDTNPAA